MRSLESQPEMDFHKYKIHNGASSAIYNVQYIMAVGSRVLISERASREFIRQREIVRAGAIIPH
jgi:hypothetical protein